MYRLAVLASVLLIAGSVAAEDIVFQYSLDPGQISIQNWAGMDVIDIPGGMVPFNSGDPSLPGTPYTFVLPQGTTIDRVTVEPHEIMRLPEKLNIAPVTAAALSRPLVLAEPSNVYFTPGQFPSNPVGETRCGNRSGFRLGSFVLVPFSYDPLSGEVTVITSATVTVHCVQDGSAQSVALTPRQLSTAEEAVASIVDNPEMVRSWSPQERPATDGDPVWVAIGPAAQDSVLQPLVDHRNAVTGQSEYVSVEWITSNYTGYDTPEKIRNYLKDQFTNHSLIYALIIGDYGETTRISSLTTSSGNDSLKNVVDEYYIDLDGNWDYDGDHNYGEAGDGIDYYSDIYVGRFSSDSPGFIQTMVNKTIAYETTSPDGDWQTTAMLAGAGLWPPDYWGSFICEDIAALIPSGWTVDKLYETPAGHPNNQIDIINDGCSYAAVQGHGNWAGIYWYDYDPLEMVGTGNYGSMHNIDKLTIFHSMACMAGELTQPYCIAERLMLSPQGGSVGVMFNSSYGWGTPPSRGPSEWLEYTFAQQLFQEGETCLGIAQCNAKDDIQPLVSVPLINWVTQENNLLGDPALTFITGQTGIEGSGASTAMQPCLSAPYPNPTSSGCSIGYDLPASAAVDLTVYDISGRAVRNIYSGRLAQGQGSVAFDGRDDSGNPLPSGCYTVVMSGSDGVTSVPMMVLR